MIYANFGGIRDLLKQNLVPSFCRNQNKGVNISVETHITLDEIYYKINISLGPIFFFPGDSHTTGLVILLHLGLEGVTEVDTDPKGRFASFKVTSLMTEISVFMPLQGIAPGNSWLEGASLRDYKMKMKETKTN